MDYKVQGGDWDMANHVDCDRQPTSGIWAWMYERVRTQTADRRRNARM